MNSCTGVSGPFLSSEAALLPFLSPCQDCHWSTLHLSFLSTRCRSGMFLPVLCSRCPFPLCSQSALHSPFTELTLFSAAATLLLVASNAVAVSATVLPSPCISLSLPFCCLTITSFSSSVRIHDFSQCPESIKRMLPGISLFPEMLSSPGFKSYGDPLILSAAEFFHLSHFCLVLLMFAYFLSHSLNWKIY